MLIHRAEIEQGPLPLAVDVAPLNSLALLDLSKQQRNLLLLRPVFALELNKNSHGTEGKGTAGLMDGIDTHYLVLSVLDFMMEGTTMNMGSTQGEVLEHLTSVAAEMKPSLTPTAAATVAETVIDALDNKVKGYKEFVFDYFDAKSKSTKVAKFRLVTYEPDLEDVYRYKPTSEGYLVYLGMLDLAPEDAQVLMEKMIDVLMKRGAFEAALEIAKRARKLSLEYRQLIQERVTQAIRAPGSVNFMTDIQGKLMSARDHVKQRQSEDHRMEEAVREALLGSEDAKARQDLSQLLKTLQGAGLVRSWLVNDITVAPGRYLDAQKAVFRARRPAGLPDLESRLLPELLALPHSVVADNGESCISGFYPPTWPRIYELNTVFRMLLERRPDEDALEEDDGEITPHVPYPERYSKALINEVEAWATRKFASEGTYRLDELLELGRAEGFDYNKLQFVIRRLFRLYAPSESVFPHVQVEEDGRFSLDLGIGTNLKFIAEKASDV